MQEKLEKVCCPALETKSSESFSKQPTQLIIAAHNCHTIIFQTLNSHFWITVMQDKFGKRVLTVNPCLVLGDLYCLWYVLHSL